MHSIVALTLAAAWYAPAPAAAQASGGPSEFVRALAQSGIVSMVDEDSVSVVEGRIPPRWASLLPVPPAGRVLGTVFGPSAATVYVVVRGTPEAAATLVEATAAAKGWVAQRTPELPNRGPFLGQPLPRGPGQYCRGGQERLIVAPRASPAGESVVQLLYMSGDGSACSQEAVSPATDLLPPLQAPPLPEGARPSDCYAPGRGVNTSGRGTRLVSDASPAAILAGYARQLEAAGWQAEAGATAPAFGAWSKPAAGGGTNRVVLSVTAEPGTRGPCRSVSMTVEQRR